MLSPKRTKFRKQQRGRMKGIASRGNKIAFGDYALQALEPCWITSRQIEAGRRAMTRYARIIEIFQISSIFHIFRFQ